MGDPWHLSFVPDRRSRVPLTREPDQCRCQGHPLTGFFREMGSVPDSGDHFDYWTPWEVIHGPTPSGPGRLSNDFMVSGPQLSCLHWVSTAAAAAFSSRTAMSGTW